MIFIVFVMVFVIFLVLAFKRRELFVVISHSILGADIFFEGIMIFINKTVLAVRQNIYESD